MIDTVYVTPHAVQRYIERVQACSHADAIAAIVADIKAPSCVQPGPGRLLTVTGARPRRTRYRVAPPLPGYRLPAVVTVL